MARVRIKDRNPEWVAMNSVGQELGETNDCAVISTALAFGVTYEESHKAYKRYGRVARTGSCDYTIFDAMSSFKSKGSFKAYSWKEVLDLEAKVDDDRLHFGNVLPLLDKESTYIMIGDEHMVAVKGGRIVDWSEGEHRVITSMYKVELH